ncbi:MAG: helix-turn-helix domain-containing protein [Candidatus Onthomonas sp.]
MGILSEICNDNGITLHYATDAVVSAIGCGDGLKSGFCTNICGKNRIFLPENSSHYGKVYVGAHELAHLLLGHIDSDCPASRLPAEVQEDEANSFAGAFLALYLMEEYTSLNRKEETQVDKLTLTVPELADTLNISLTNAYQLVRRADFPSVKLGARWIIPVRPLEDWLANQAQKNAPTGGPNLQ